MSDFKRLQRILKSRIPRFPKGSDYSYTLEDARMMITDLGLELSPKAFEYLTHTDVVLDDFNTGVYLLEDRIGRRITTEFNIIDPELEPKVYEEEGVVGFSIKHKKQELVFAEYEIPK